jgi:signal transduction histidine kinase
MDEIYRLQEEPLMNYLMKDTGIIFLAADHQGVILIANSFVESLTGLKLTGLKLDSVFLDFTGSFSLDNCPGLSKERQLLNVKTYSNIPETFYFTCIKQAETIYILGEADPHEFSLLRKNLLELNKELNNLTRELHKKNAELIRLNELKNQFLGMAAHDLRNPLGVIMGYSDFLIDDLQNELPGDQLKMLQSINSSSEFMLHLINDLLDVTVIEAGKLVINKQTIDLAGLMRHNVELNGSIAAKKGIGITLAINDSIPEIVADAVKIEQVLNNLLGNAIKFSPLNSNILVNLGVTEASVLISINDQGPGMASTEIETVFAPFNKGHARATGGEKSTGLGLAIVRNIIQGHGGKIWVDSIEGLGTTFSFTLPCSEREIKNINL